MGTVMVFPVRLSLMVRVSSGLNTRSIGSRWNKETVNGLVGLGDGHCMVVLGLVYGGV